MDSTTGSTFKYAIIIDNKTYGFVFTDNDFIPQETGSNATKKDKNDEIDIVYWKTPAPEQQNLKVSLPDISQKQNTDF